MVVKLKQVALVVAIMLSMVGLLSLAGDSAAPPVAAPVAHRPTTAPTTALQASTTVPPTIPVRTTLDRASRGSGRPVTRLQGGDVWAALARCESGGRADAVSRSGKYLGAFQFSMATWRSVGGPGSPIDHDYATQLHYAKVLQARSGWGQWPTCSRKLGLR